MKTKTREIKTFIDRFGSNRMNAEHPGKLLRGVTCVNVPFVGGFCEVPYFIPYKHGGHKDSVGTANVVNVNDLDRHVMNLARVVRAQRVDLQQQLDGTDYQPDVLAHAQDVCKMFEKRTLAEMPAEGSNDAFGWAYHYFIASWMTRGGKGGTKGEFDSGLSVRWKSGGGDSVVRFRNATQALTEWEVRMRRCTFTTMDAFDFISECKKKDRDIPENGMYVDADWPGDGKNYKHRIGDDGQTKLRDVLSSFERTRVVVRYGDCEMIRDLYPESRWTWNLLTGRTQANDDKAEVLLTNWKP